MLAARFLGRFEGLLAPGRPGEYCSSGGLDTRLWAAHLCGAGSTACRGAVHARLGLVAPTSRRETSGLRFCSNAPGLNRLACRGGVTGVPCAWQAFPGGLPYRVPEYVEEAHPTNSTLPGLVPERIGSFEPSRILHQGYALSPRPVPASSGGRRHEDSAPQWAEEELERRQRR